RLVAEECRRALDCLVRLGAARMDPGTGRYHAAEAHLAFSDFQAGTSFQAFFIRSLHAAEANARRRFDEPGNLFINSVLSVDEGRLPELKEELKGLLSHYIDHAESPTGTRLATLVCALFDARAGR